MYMFSFRGLYLCVFILSTVPSDLFPLIRTNSLFSFLQFFYRRKPHKLNPPYTPMSHVHYDRTYNTLMLYHIHAYVIYIRGLFNRRRTLEATSEIQHSTDAISAQPKSKSLSDLFGLIPVGILRSQRKSAEDFIKDKKSCTVLETADEFARSTSSISGIGSSNDEIQFPDCVRHKAVQTESIESLDKQSSSQQQSHRPSADLFLGNLLGKTSNDMTHHHHHYQHHHHHHHHHSGGSSVSGHSLSGHDDTSNVKKLRPVLVKQKQSICSPSQMGSDEGSLGELCCSLESDRLAELGGGTPGGLPLPPGGIPGHEVCWGEMKKSVRDLPELKPPSGGNTLQVPTPIPPTRGGIAAGSSFWKQSSLNEELIFSERLKEKEMLKQNIQKQCSLNEELIYKRRENTRWDQMKEAFLNSSNVKCLQLIKNGISNRFRGSDGSQNQSSSSDGGQGGGNGSMGSGGSSSIPSRPSTTQASSSIRNGIVRMLQNWKQGEDSSSNGNTFLPSHSSSSLSPNSFLGARRGSKESSSTRRGLFPPFFLRRSSAGSLNVTKGTKGDLLNDPSSVNGNILSPPHLKRRPSENELLHECSGGNGNKLLPGVRHVRKLSREEGSDSSKDSSFQSDTSVDSEDSFASVIFIPNKGGLDGTNDAFTFNTETRANSTDSDRSPKSPASRLSPPNHNLPKSPSPLANELLRRRSPEVSPTKLSLYGGGGGGGSGGGHKETSKFVFDESATTRLQSPAISSTSICEQGELTTHSPTVTVSLIETKVEEEEDEEEVSSKEEVTSVTTSVPQESLHYPHPHPQQQVHHQKKKVERIEVLRKPAVLPEGHKVTRQLVRRSLPKALAFELFNPETDDADTSDTSSSSPNSISSVVSVVNEESLSQATTSTGEQTTSGSGGKPSGVKEDSNCKSSLETTQALPELSEELLIPIPEEDRMAKETTSSQQVVSNAPDTSLEEEDNSKDHGTTQSTTSSSGGGGGSGGGSRRSSILEAAASVVSSFENLVVQSSPKTRRKLTLAKLGSTSEWLLSLPSEAATTSSNNNSVAASSPVSSSSASTTSSSAPTTHHPPLAKRPSGERRTTSGEKLLLGDVKKYQQRGPDARWPSSIIDESPPQTAKTEETLSHPEGPSSAEAPNKILEEMEERDSLFDSLENLCSGRKDHPSRNPSIDSSVRMSSTCSIRGGESFESWSSAKSSLTNSSSTHQQKPSVASTIPLPPLSVVNRIPASMCNLPGSSGRIRHQGTSSKSSSAAGEDTESSAAENSTALTYHRYYHVFREGELDKLIEKYVKNLHIISSYYDHANWCIIAEKVQVWTI